MKASRFCRTTNIVYVGSTTAESGTSAATTLPAGWAAGDFAIVLSNGNTTTPSLPSGWTSIATQTSAAQFALLAYRVLQAGDGSTTWTNAGRAICSVFRNVSGPLGTTTFSVNSGTALQYPIVSSVPDPLTSIGLLYAFSQSTTMNIETSPTLASPGTVASLANIVGAAGEIQGWYYTMPVPTVSASLTLNSTSVTRAVTVILGSK